MPKSIPAFILALVSQERLGLANKIHFVASTGAGELSNFFDGTKLIIDLVTNDNHFNEAKD